MTPHSKISKRRRRRNKYKLPVSVRINNKMTSLALVQWRGGKSSTWKQVQGDLAILRKDLLTLGQLVVLTPAVESMHLEREEITITITHDCNQADTMIPLPLKGGFDMASYFPHPDNCTDRRYRQVVDVVVQHVFSRYDQSHSVISEKIEGLLRAELAYYHHPDGHRDRSLLAVFLCFCLLAGYLARLKGPVQDGEIEVTVGEVYFEPEPEPEQAPERGFDDFDEDDWFFD